MDVDSALYLVSAILQLCAMVYAVRMTHEVHDKRPWLLLFFALFLMFVYRIAAPQISLPFVQRHASAAISVPISFLLFVSLLSLRRVTAAERESREMAAQRTSERD